MKKLSRKSSKKRKRKPLKVAFGFGILFLGFLILTLNLFQREKQILRKEKEIGKEVFEKRNLKIAIVMDDLGQSDKFLQWFYQNRFPLTLSFLPNLPHSKEMAERLNSIGYEIIIHLPMEPESYPEANPGKDALILSMKKDEIGEKIEEFRRQFPFARGLNNHMGSSFTSNLYKMEELMEILKVKGFFFLDSRTTPETKGYKAAKKAGVPFVERDVFLDNVLERKAIKRQFEELLKKAKKKGYGIGICHPHPQTFDAIKEIFLEYSGKVDFVKLSGIFSTFE